MDTKAFAYETDALDDGSRTEGRIKRLSKDIRIHVKYIHNYEIFSHEWVELADSLKQIAHVALNEKNIPMVQKDLSSMHGRKKHGTLWDQEKSELAIRIVLEEGKLNLCMRLLSELMTSQRLSNFYTLLECSCMDNVYNTDQMEKTVAIIEKSLGVIVLLCIQHVESLQICDTSALLELCARNLSKEYDISDLQKLQRQKRLFSTSLKSYNKMQVNIAFHFLYHLIRHIPEISEATIMQTIIKKRILKKVLRFMSTYKEYMPQETAAIAAKFIDHVFQTDSFKTKQKALVYKTFEEDIIQFREDLNKIIELGYLQECEISHIESFVFTLKRKDGDSPVAEKKAWDNLVNLMQATEL